MTRSRKVYIFSYARQGAVAQRRCQPARDEFVWPEVALRLGHAEAWALVDGCKRVIWLVCFLVLCSS